MLDLRVTENVRPHMQYCLLKLTSDEQLPDMLPGQFVEVRVDHSASTFLRRPISINFVDWEKNELWLLIQLVGDGTRQLAESSVGDLINVVLPLGNGFTLPAEEIPSKRLLLVGGGVGTAPMLYLGACLKAKGYEPIFLSSWVHVQQEICNSCLISNGSVRFMRLQKMALTARRVM